MTKPTAIKKPKKRQRCYWCGRLTAAYKRITLMGPAARRVYEHRDGSKCR